MTRAKLTLTVTDLGREFEAHIVHGNGSSLTFYRGDLSDLLREAGTYAEQQGKALVWDKRIVDREDSPVFARKGAK